jgi:hypothetical protein
MGDLSTFYSLPQSLSSEEYSFPCRGLSHLQKGNITAKGTQGDSSGTATQPTANWGRVQFHEWLMTENFI